MTFYRPVASHINITASRFWSVVSTFAQEPPEAPLSSMASASSFFESGVLPPRLLQALNFRHLHTAIPLRRVKRGIGNGTFAGRVHGGYPSFGFAENTDDLFVGKTLSWGCPHVAYEDITNIRVLINGEQVTGFSLQTTERRTNTKFDVSTTASIYRGLRSVKGKLWQG